MSEQDWKPSAPLATATHAALGALARQWPRAMQLALESTTAGQEYLADYAAAMRGVDLRAIPMAAREWIATESMPPRPADLGKLARELTRQHFPTIFASSAVVTTQPHQPIEHLKNAVAIDALSKRAHAVLGSWQRTGKVWALLFQTAPSDDHREAVRIGNVPYDVFDDAVERIRSGVRPKSGPLTTLLEETITP